MKYTEMQIREIVKEKNKLCKALKEHTEIAKKVIAAIDAEMKKPSDVERGKRIAKIISALEFENDSKRHFDLGEKFPLSR